MKIKRENGWYGILLGHKVILNEKDIKKLQEGKTIKIEIDGREEEHTIKLKQKKMKCRKCGGENLITLDSITSDPEGIRHDRYCPDCDTKWGLTKAMMIEIADEKYLPEPKSFVEEYDALCRKWGCYIVSDDPYCAVVIEAIGDGKEHEILLKNIEEEK